MNKLTTWMKTHSWDILRTLGIVGPWVMVAGFLFWFVTSLDHIDQNPPILDPKHREPLREFSGINDLEKRVQTIEATLSE